MDEWARAIIPRLDRLTVGQIERNHMTHTRIFALACAALATAPLYAASFSYNLGTVSLSDTTLNFPVNTAGATGRARAFTINGIFAAGTGFPWSSDLQVGLLGVTNQGNGTALRAMGGNNTSNGFTFTGSSPTWNNNLGGTGDQHPRGFLANQASSDLGGSITMQMRLGVSGRTASLFNARVTFLTDVVAPTAIDLTNLSPVMTSRANSLTTTTSGNFRYQAVTFTAQETGVHAIGLYNNGVSTHLMGYNGAFSASNPLTNLIGVDHVGDLTEFRSSNMFLNLTAGQTYTFVATTTNSDEFLSGGSLVIAGPEAIPEPATMSVLGAAGVAMARRRRAKKS